MAEETERQWNITVTYTLITPANVTEAEVREKFNLVVDMPDEWHDADDIEWDFEELGNRDNRPGSPPPALKRVK